MDTRARILKIREIQAAALFNTPSFGLHMAEVAQEMGINPAKDLTVRKMVYAGEPLSEPTRKGLKNYGMPMFTIILEGQRPVDG